MILSILLFGSLQLAPAIIMKRVIKLFAAYYIAGLIILNIFSVFRFLGSGNLLEIAPTVVIHNLSNPIFYGIVLIWPLYIGFFFYSYLSGNFGD